MRANYNTQGPMTMLATIGGLNVEASRNMHNCWAYLAHFLY